MLGWWIFLDTDDLRSAYSAMWTQFPLSQTVVDLYVGPNTTRGRHPLVKLPDYFTNGFAELYTILAGKIRLHSRHVITPHIFQLILD